MPLASGRAVQQIVALCISPFILGSMAPGILRLSHIYSSHRLLWGLVNWYSHCSLECIRILGLDNGRKTKDADSGCHRPSKPVVLNLLARTLEQDRLNALRVPNIDLGTCSSCPSTCTSSTKAVTCHHRGNINRVCIVRHNSDIFRVAALPCSAELPELKIVSKLA